MMASYLLDTNILVRMAQPDDPGHKVATEAVTMLGLAGHDLFVNSQNLVESWRVLTGSTASNYLGIAPSEAQIQVEAVLDRFDLLADNPEVFTTWFELLTRRAILGVRAFDARLVAVMMAHGVENLLTFDVKDFSAFDEITWISPADITEIGAHGH